MDLQYPYIKCRREFGKQLLFCEEGPVMCDSIKPDPNEYKFYILRNPVHAQVQNVPLTSVNTINTIRAEITTSGVNHDEGGWPADVHYHDIEIAQRYRRRVEKEDDYIHCVMKVTPQLEHYLLQNNAIDLYETYYTEYPTLPPNEKFTCRKVNAYRDNTSSVRTISSISFEPEGEHFAVAYLNINFNRVSLSPKHSYVWNIERTTDPTYQVNTKSPLLDLQFSYKESGILAGGLLNGQVAVWDTRVEFPVNSCPPHQAHRDMVRSVLFTNSKSGKEFFSGGPDGVCKWWDMRNMSYPYEQMIMHYCHSSLETQKMENASGISVMEYEWSMPTRFMVGTENGYVMSGNRKGKTSVEMIPVMYTAHLGSVWSLQRNPGFLKNFLTVGDWTARVFSEDCKESPILWTPPMRHRITAGTWSPGRVSLIALTHYNGQLTFWDLLRRQYEPVLTMQVCKDPLVKMKYHENSTHIACGSAIGNVYMCEVSHSMSITEKGEKWMMHNMFEREIHRERLLEARTREIKLKHRQAEEGGGPQDHDDIPDPTINDKDLADAAIDFIHTVKKELTMMT